MNEENEVPLEQDAELAGRVRATVATFLADPYWKPQDTDNVIVWADGRWCSPGLDSTYGRWKLQAGQVFIAVYEEDED